MIQEYLKEKKKLEFRHQHLNFSLNIFIHTTHKNTFY